jgi:hypothetical protein
VQHINTQISSRVNGNLNHTPPTRSPDAQGHTPSTQRALPRRRLEDPEPSTLESSIPPHNSHDVNQNRLLPSPNILSQPQRQGIRRPERFRSPEIPFNQQLKLCTRITHQKPRHAFIDPQSNIEYDICNQCRKHIQERREQQRQRRESSPEVSFNEQLKLCGRNPHYKRRQEFVDPQSGTEYNSCNECRESERLRGRERREEAAARERHFRNLWREFDEHFPPDPNEEEDGIPQFTYIFLTFRAAATA